MQTTRHQGATMDQNQDRCHGHSTGYSYDTHVCTDLCTINTCCKPKEA